MDNESSYNCSFLFSSLVDDHDPDSQDVSYNKSEANSNSNSNSINHESRARKRPRNSDAHSDGFNPEDFFTKEPKYNQDNDFYVSPAALNPTTTLEDVLITRTNIFDQPLDITEINEQCEIFTNDRGTVKLCIDGYLYIKNMKSGSTCYWQCVQKNLKNCHGCAVTYAVDEKHYLKRIRREHSHETIVYNTRGFARVYEIQLKNLKENLSDCRFTKNRWGNPKLVIGGYFYVRQATKGQNFYWKCEQKGQCDAFINTQRNSDGTHKMGRLAREHTHQPKPEHEIKELRLSYIPKFSQNHLEQINKTVTAGENESNIPNKKSRNSNIQKTAQTSIKSQSGGKGVDEGDSSSSLTLFSPNMPKLLTLKSSCDQNDEQFESDNSQTTSQFIKKSEKTLSRQSSQTSISQGSGKSSAAVSSTKKINKQKLQFKRIEIGEKCEFVFLIDGVFKMLLNGFAYEMAEGYEGKSSALWRCSGHCRIFVECLATASTGVFEGDHYLRGIKGRHNHPPCDEDVEDSETNNVDDEIDYDEQHDNLEEQDEYSDGGSNERLNREDSNNSFEDNKISGRKGNHSGEYINNIGDENGKCEFIVTKRGLPKLTRRGYYYVRNSVNKNRTEITYWKCELKGKCTGTLVTETKSNGYYVKSAKEHNHPPDKNKYVETRFDKPDEVNHFFTETDSQINEDSSEEILLIPDDESKLKISNNKSKQTIKTEDPLAGGPIQNAATKTIEKYSDIKLDLITTARGMPKIARNGYYYCKSSVNKNRHEITYWKCELKGQCKGFLISVTKNDGYYFKSERAHSHPPDPEKYKKVRKSSFEELNNSVGTSYPQRTNMPQNRASFEGNFHLNRNPFVNPCSQQSRDFIRSVNNANRNKQFEARQHYKEDDYSYNNEESKRPGSVNLQPLKFENRKLNRNVEDLPLIPEGGDPNTTYECEFIISCQGNPKLCLNGYMYTKNRDKNTNFYWNCEIKKSRHCMGYCVTEVRNGKHIVKKIRAHNHKADLRREMLSKKLSNILQKVYAKPLWNPRKIIDAELEKLPDDIRRSLPKAYSIQRMVKRKVQEKVSTVRQSLVNGDYAPIPNMEPSTSKQQPIPQQNRNTSLNQNRNKYSENFKTAQQLYNDEYNFNNLYNSNNRSNTSSNFYQQNVEQPNINERFGHNAGYHNQMSVNFNDPNQFDEPYSVEDDYNCEIKNEPIDDYGYQNFDGEIEEQMDTTYDNSGYHEGMDTDSWNNGSAFANSYTNDGTFDDNYDGTFDNGNHPTATTSDNSNQESINSSDNSENSQNSHHSEHKTDNQEDLQVSKSREEPTKQPEPTTNVVYKKNQIAKKRIRAPDKIIN